MDYFFVSRAKVRQHFEPPVDAPVDGWQVVNRRAGLPDGTPFFVDEHMRPLEPLCSYFFELAKSCSKSTMADYAYDLMALVDFLAALTPPRDLLSATEDDLVAYRDYRTKHQDRPVSAMTWKRNRVAITSFYEWAKAAGWLERTPYLTRKGGRNVLYVRVTKALDVRHLTYAQWRQFHQVGLGGYLPSGELDPEFRGEMPLRNMAAAELAVTTGLRLREFSALLDIEVGPPLHDTSPATVELQAIAKYGLAREVRIQHDVLRSIDAYRRTERAILVRQAATALARRRDELFVVSDVDKAQMKVRGRLHGRDRTFTVSAIPAELRRVMVMEGDHGLEPMALFVGRGGRMLGKSRWEQIFTDASERAWQITMAAKTVVMPRRVAPHALRHTFAVYMLQILTQQLLREEAERMAAGGTGAYLATHISRNPLLRVQELLGHRSPASTMTYLRYIEDTTAIVAAAVAEWTDADRTYADYATQLAGRQAN